MSVLEVKVKSKLLIVQVPITRIENHFIGC